MKKFFQPQIVETIVIVNKEVDITQKSFIEQDASRAQKILNKLLQQTNSEVSSITRVVRVDEK